MKSLVAAMAIGVLVSTIGCDRGTAGGPGASSPPAKTSIIGQADQTFSLSAPSTNLYQGESKPVPVQISRGENFGLDVSLTLGALPKGVTMDPANPVIKHGDADATFTLRAAEDAALGDFTVSITGKPILGSVAVSELKFSVAKRDPEDVAKEATKAAKAMRDAYVVAAQKQMDQFATQYSAIKERVAKSEGQIRTDLDAKRADAETKLEAATRILDELKSASADGWEDFKQGVEDAFDDLKQVLV